MELWFDERDQQWVARVNVKRGPIKHVRFNPGMSRAQAETMLITILRTDGRFLHSTEQLLGVQQFVAERAPKS